MPPRALALTVAVVALLARASPASALQLTPVGSFSQPVYVTAPPADPHRLFVVEQGGRIIEVRDGQKLDPPFLDIARDVKSGGEQGLLSMAFAPDYAASGRFYVYFTAPRAGDSKGSVITVREYKRAAGTSDAAYPASGRKVLEVDHPTNGNHNGGQLQFGPDGLLYAGTGDGGSGNDPPGNAQNLGSRLGKLLRFDPLSSAAPEIFAYGLRNPFRFSFDRQTGDLTIGDVGQGAYEEVDFSPHGTAPGRNYGWNCREGLHATPGVTCSAPGAVDPVLEKSHSGDGYCAIIGGYVVRDAALGPLAGRYVYGDNCSAALRSAQLTSSGSSGDAATGLTVAGLTSFGEDSCGHVYAASGSGPVFRIDGATFTPCAEPPVATPAPVVTLRARRAQHVLRQHGAFRLVTSCDRLCSATATGTVRIAGSRRAYVLKAVTRQLGAGARVTISLRASKGALRAFRSAFRRGRPVRATLRVTARNQSSAAGSAARRVLATA